MELTTKDGIRIIGDYYQGESSGVLLLHMMPRDRKSWMSFAEKLKLAGFSSLAIDLRGHGESAGGPTGYKTFSDAEHQASRFDVEAAAEFLKSMGAQKIYLVGASIGANLSLEYLSLHPEAVSAILLSPGLDYKGLKTEPFMGKLSADQGIFLVAGDDDVYSRDTVQQLAGKISLDERHKLQIFERGGHGTTIFENRPEFMEELVRWLKQF